MGYSAAKRALANSFVRGLMHDFDEHGEKVIQAVREKSPDVYLRLAAQLIPQTLEIEVGEPMTLEAAMAECVEFLIALPDEQYQTVQQAVNAERRPVIEHIAAHWICRYTRNRYFLPSLSLRILIIHNCVYK